MKHLCSISKLDASHDECSDSEEVQGQGSGNGSEFAGIRATLDVHDSIDGSGTSEDKSDIHGNLGQEKTAQHQNRQHHWQLLHEVLMNAHGIVESDPVSIGQLLGVSAFAAVGEPTSSGLRSWESFLVFLLELGKELFSEDAESGGCDSNHAHQEALDAEDAASEQNQGVLFWQNNRHCCRGGRGVHYTTFSF